MLAKINFENLDKSYFQKRIINIINENGSEKIYKIEISDFEDLPYKIKLSEDEYSLTLFKEDELIFI